MNSDRQQTVQLIASQLRRELNQGSPYFRTKPSAMRSSLNQEGVVGARISGYLVHLFPNRRILLAAEVLLGNPHVLPRAVDLDTKTRILAEFLGANRPTDKNSCWLWPRLKTKAGYGQIVIGQRHFMMHRLSFQIYKGRIPFGFCVMHACDTPACFNPNHLHLGTHGENMADKARKGRARRPPRNPPAQYEIVARVERTKVIARLSRTENQWTE